MMRKSRTIGLLFFLLIGLWSSGPRADVEVQLDGDHVAGISRMFQRYHISREPFEDAHSALMLKHFEQQLDPGHFYLQQNDIAEFQVYRDKLDDLIPRGNIDPAFQIHRRFLQRVDERDELVKRILAGKLDLSGDETVLVDRREAPYARDDKDAEAMWVKKLKLEMLEQTTSGKTEDEAKEALLRRYHSAHLRMRQYTRNEVVSLFLNAFASTYDPHSAYMSPDELENFNISLRLSLEGIGATLRWEDGYTIISSIIPGGAAARQGSLRQEDKIIAVAQGKDGPFEDVRNQRLTDVVKLIRGKRGSQVRLAYLRRTDGVREKRFEVTIARDKIVLTDREAKGTVREVKSPERKIPYKIGVAELPSFYVDFSQRHSNPENYKSAFRDMERILKQFVAQGVDGVVLDLRDNGGGGLDEAVSLSGLFLERGATVVRVKDYNGETVSHDNPNSPVYRGPLVVFVNRYSASASEILAGALKDYGRAIIIGDRSTFGKGTVQNIINLPAGLGALKTTVAKFYRPGNGSTQNRGVEADVVLPSLNNQMEIGEASLDNALPWDTLAGATAVHKPWGDLTPLIPVLVERSRRRQSKSAYFQKVSQEEQNYVEKQKGRKEISIKQLLAERTEAEAESPHKNGAGGERSPAPGEAKKPPAPDHAMDEAVDVLVDVIRLTTGGRNIAIGRAG